MQSPATTEPSAPSTSNPSEGYWTAPSGAAPTTSEGFWTAPSGTGFDHREGGETQALRNRRLSDLTSRVQGSSAAVSEAHRWIVPEVITMSKPVLESYVDYEIRSEERFTELGTAMRNLHGEVGKLQGNVGKLQGDVGKIQGNVGELRGEVGELRGELGKLRGDMERSMSEFSSKLDATLAEMLNHFKKI